MGLQPVARDFEEQFEGERVVSISWCEMNREVDGRGPYRTRRRRGLSSRPACRLFSIGDEMNPDDGGRIRRAPL